MSILPDKSTWVFVADNIYLKSTAKPVFVEHSFVLRDPERRESPPIDA